jgi:hypothetical protein
MRILFISFFIACSGCAGGIAAAPALAPSAVLLQINAMAADNGCSASAQCHTLPLGARACGGPQAYLAWSSAHTDGAALRLLGERYAQQEKTRIAASGEMSDCRMLADPGAECRAGTCRLRPAGAAGQGANAT